jgi:hypothetical protein
MHLSPVDTALWLAGVAGEALLVGVLFFRRSYRSFPVFFSWILFILLLEPTFYWLLIHSSAATYYKVFFALNFPQYLLEAGVLAEIALNVLRPVRQAISRTLLLVFAAAMLLIAIVGLLAAAHLNAATLADPRSFVVINMTMAILRLALFLAIAGFSQLLGISWKNHVLQIASGLAFYAIVSLIVELAHSQLRGGPAYSASYQALVHLRIGGYLCTLYFWCYAFAKKEAPRKEFSPQMAQILVSLTGSTKRQRAVLARTRDH